MDTFKGKYDYLSYSLKDFVNMFPEIAHVKDAVNFKYQLTNRNNLDVYSLPSEIDLIGKTVFDLEKIMGNRWPKDFAQNIHAYDTHIRKIKQKTKCYSTQELCNKFISKCPCKIL